VELKKNKFKNKIVLIFNMSLGLVVIGFISMYFMYIFNVKGRDLLKVFVSVHAHILVSWPDDDLSLGLKLVAIQ